MPERRGRNDRHSNSPDRPDRSKVRRKTDEPETDRGARSKYRHRALKEAVIIEELEAMEEEYSY